MRSAIYKPRFTPESFDAVFAHQELQHLSRPVDALRQFRSLLKPGGVVGARDVDWGSTTFYPENHGMRRFLALYDELARLNGGKQMPAGFFHIGSMKQDFLRFELRLRPALIPIRSRQKDGATRMPTVHCNRILLRNLWSTVFRAVPSWRLLRMVGVPGVAIQTHSFVSLTRKWWDGRVSIMLVLPSPTV